jgi:hypothetical protein
MLYYLARGMEVLVVVFLLLWKMALESMLKKNYFHIRIKFHFLMTTRVRSLLAYSEGAPFPICFLFSEIAQGTRKREYADLKK